MASNVVGFRVSSVMVGNLSLSISNICFPLCWFHFQADCPQIMTKIVHSSYRLHWLV